MRGLFQLAEKLVASQERLCYVEIASVCVCVLSLLLSADAVGFISMLESVSASR